MTKHKAPKKLINGIDDVMGSLSQIDKQLDTLKALSLINKLYSDETIIQNDETAAAMIIESFDDEMMAEGETFEPALAA